MRDWQRHQHLLHLHDSAKFTQPIPRTGKPAHEHSLLGSICITIITLSIIGLLVLLFTAGAT